jgi:hypothetical protein
MQRFTVHALSTVAAGALVFSRVASVGAQGVGLLDGVRVSEERGIAVVTIDVSERVRYLSHALSPSGTVLQVRIRRVATSSDDAGGNSGRDTLIPADYEARLVSGVSYEGGAGDEGTLSVGFRRPVRPTVYQRGDQQSISISLPLDVGARREPTPMPASEPSPPAPGAEAPSVVGGDAATGEAPTPAPSAMPIESDASAAAVMEKGRRAMIAKDYTAAVQLFTKVLQSGDPAFKQEAQELLGVAQERSNHLAHAKAEYEEYLRLYPTGEGAERVRQRLAALLTAPPGPTDAAKPATAQPGFVRYFTGSLSQFIRRDSSILDEDGEVIDQSYLASDLDVTGRLRSGNYDVRTQLSGGYRLDIEGSSPSSNLRMRYLYLDATDRQHGLNARVGRQSRSTGGVLGRFDGALLNYRVTPRTRVNAVGGFPVDLTMSDSLDPTRYFYGLSVDFGTFAQYWDVSGFAIEQRDEGLLDRRAIGGELRYLRPEASFFTLVDYDVSYLALNILLVQGNYQFANAATLGIVFDYRDTPALTTNNALIGQPFDSLDELQDIYDDDQIRDLAEDRTQQSRSGTLSGSYPLTAKLQLATDFTVSSFSSTPASGGVEATPSTGLEYTISSQLIGNDILWTGDVQILGARYAHADITDTGSLMINERFSLGDALRLNPRFQFDLQGRDGGSTVAILRPAFLFDYRWRRALSLEIEVGYEGVREISGSDGSGRHGYYVYAGYRWDF